MVPDKTQSSSLSTKITVIVFWGLVVIGLVFSSLFLHVKESSTRAQRDRFSDSIGFEVNKLANRAGIHANAELVARFDRYAQTHPRIRIELYDSEDRLVMSSGPVFKAGQGQEYRRELDYISAQQPRRASLVFQYPHIDTILHKERRNLLLTLGGVLMVLGASLKLLLERILTRPISRMVRTAQAISGGDKTVTFDAGRDDEFGYLGSFVNEAVRRLVLSENEAQRSRELAEVTLHSIADAVVTTNAQGRVVYMNLIAQKLTGYELDSVQGRPVEEVIELVDESTGQAVENPVVQCLLTNKSIQMPTNCMLMRRDGLSVPIDPSVAPIRDAQKAIHGTVMVIHDMSVVRTLHRELSYQASHDPLTGLYNRREFDQQLQFLLDKSVRDGHEHTLCYLDLDQFKVVNDSCGHAAGDMLLKGLSARLQQGLRKADVLARLGGDEFGLLLYHCPISTALEIADKIRQIINEFRFHWEGKVFQVGVSIGLASLHTELSTTAEVLSAADMACNAAKEDGRNRIHVYHPDDKEIHRRREEMSMVAAVRKALVSDAFDLFAQPITPLTASGELEHYEILVRMRDGAGGHVPPGAFLPALERFQLMAWMDRWVIQHTVDFLLDQLEGGRRIALSINLSGQSINEDAFLDELVEQVRRLGTDSRLLCFEITETAVVGNMDRAVRLIETLKTLGCSLALDDFGTGVSTFSYLKHLAVDFVKIDGVFIRQAHESVVDQAMVKAIVEVANVMGIRTIAEFVETETVHETMQALGVDYGQGYWYAPPQSVDRLFDTAPASHGTRQTM